MEEIEDEEWYDAQVARDMREIGESPLYCAKCAYDLRGSNPTHCPECGNPIDPNDVDSVTTQPTTVRSQAQQRRDKAVHMFVLGFVWLVAIGIPLMLLLAFLSTLTGWP